jgi:PAS domain S-box-containing protein
LYFGAVLVASWYGGLVAGLVTTALSAALGHAYFIADASALGWGRVATQLAAFAVEGVAISWLTSRLSDARRSAESSAKAARQAAGQLEGALKELDVGITLQDTAGMVVYANAAAARIVGLATPDELRAVGPAERMKLFDVLDEQGAALPFERLPARAVLLGHGPADLLVQVKTADRRETRWVQVAANGVHDDDGELRFVVTAFRDVTQRRAQDEALRISREWFSTALRSIGDAVIATDGDGKVTFINPVAETLTGHARSECEGRPLTDVFRILDESTREPAESPAARVLREGVVDGLANHTLLVRKDGSEIAIDDSAAPIRGADGELVGVVLVFRDVSKSRRDILQREFLARATEELNSSFDYATTLATVARLAVPRIADWCAVDVREDGGVRRLAVAHVDPAKVEFVRELERRYPSDPHASSGVPNILRTGASEMLAEIPASLIEAGAKDEEHLRIIQALELRSYIGVPLRRGGETFGVITLITAESRRVYGEKDLEFAEALADRAAVAVENARLFRQVEHARTEAVLANRTKDDFLAMLGHELRNPLAPILTALELMKLRKGQDGDREREIIERQVRHVVRLVDDLLDVSRITRGRVELTKAPVELADVVARGVEVVAPLVEERRHTLAIDVPRGLVVDADAARLGQVVANLLANAAKYTEPNGAIRVTGERDGECVLLRVRDSGIGIAAEMLSRIFDVFVQEPQAIDRAQGGLGLGLTIVQSLAHLHGGSVTARSDGPGKGSEFVVKLPVATMRVATAPEAAPPVEASGAGGRIRVLVVDDNVDALEMLVEVLTMLGHEAHHAVDGPSALALATHVRPAVALLDLGLPLLDGFQLAQRLRELPGLASIKLVAVTGYGQPSDRERTAAAGFAAHLVKPIGIDAIRSVIETVSR